jgi:hypothetical protein
MVLVGARGCGLLLACWRGRLVGVLAATAAVSVLWAAAGVGTAGAAVSPCGTAGTFSSSGSTASCTYTAPGFDTFTVPVGVGTLDVVAVGAARGIRRFELGR